MKTVKLPKLFVAGIIEPARSPFVSISLEELENAKDGAHACPGDEIVLLDLSGREYRALVAECAGGLVTLHISSDAAPAEATFGSAASGTGICLLFGALKGGLNETIVRKATELGAAEIGIFRSEYGLSRVNARDLQRLNSCAEEAASGCLRGRSPVVSYFEDFNGALSFASKYRSKFIFCESWGRPHADMSTMSGDCALAVGPEGGFSPAELNAARADGFLSASLGRHVVGSDTAAISAVALAAYISGAMR